MNLEISTIKVKKGQWVKVKHPTGKIYYGIIHNERCYFYERTSLTKGIFVYVLIKSKYGLYKGRIVPMPINWLTPIRKSEYVLYG